MATYNSPPPNGNDVAGSAFFKKFLASAERYIQQPSRLKDLLVNVFNKARENKELGTLAHEAWDTIQSLVRLIKLSVAGEYTGVPGTTIIAAVAVLVYFISPIDLIPDFIPVVGYLDDMALIAWFSTSMKKELDKFHEWEATKAATVADPQQFAAAASERPAYSAYSARADAAASTNHSAKNAGTMNLPGTPASTGLSATDAGLGSPTSPTTKPIHEAGPDGPLPTPYADDLARTSDGSRDGNRLGGTDTGGNNR